MAETLDAFGTVHILVNNAGIDATDAPIHEYSIAEWDQVMATNLRGPFLMARAALPIMRQQGEGHIINISSEAGLEYYDESGAYHGQQIRPQCAGRTADATRKSGVRHPRQYHLPRHGVTEMSQDTPGLNHERCLYPADIADLALWLVTRRAKYQDRPADADSDDVESVGGVMSLPGGLETHR